MPQLALSFLKSLPFDFEKAVHEFVQAKKDHLTTEGAPAPSAHPAVEASVRRVPGFVVIDHNGSITSQTPDDFVADYQIVDDTPPPAPPLTAEQRKMAVHAGLVAAAQDLLNQITPPLKARLWQMQVAEAQAGMFPNNERTDAQKAIIAENEARTQRSQKIMRHLAELESVLHDMPDDMVDVWKPPPFPTA